MCLCLAANHVFLLEPSMDPAILQQAVGRAHRMGQTRPVHVTRLIMHSTVEVGWRPSSPIPAPSLPRLHAVSNALAYCRCPHQHCKFCHACGAVGLVVKPMLQFPFAPGYMAYKLTELASLSAQLLIVCCCHLLDCSSQNSRLQYNLVQHFLFSTVETDDVA